MEIEEVNWYRFVGMCISDRPTPFSFNIAVDRSYVEGARDFQKVRDPLMDNIHRMNSFLRGGRVELALVGEGPWLRSISAYSGGLDLDESFLPEVEGHAVYTSHNCTTPMAGILITGFYQWAQAVESSRV